MQKTTKLIFKFRDQINQLFLSLTVGIDTMLILYVGAPQIFLGRVLAVQITATTKKRP